MQLTTNNTLPRNWRQQVAKILAAQGLELTEQQVYDIWRGKNSDPEMVIKVKAARQRVANRYAQKLRKLQALRAIFFLSFWLF